MYTITVCMWASEEKLHCTFILFLLLDFPTIWLVGCRLTLATQRWDRNWVYSSVIPNIHDVTLAQVSYCEPAFTGDLYLHVHVPVSGERNIEASYHMWERSTSWGFFRWTELSNLERHVIVVCWICFCCYSSDVFLKTIRTSKYTLCVYVCMTVYLGFLRSNYM